MTRTRQLSPRRAVAAAVAGAVVAGFLVMLQAAPASAATEKAIVSSAGCSTHRLERNDDQSTGRVSLPFRVNFFQKTYDSLYVNNNGNVTFQDSMSTYTPFRITADTPPMIAAFFADIDTRAATSGVTTYGTTSFDGRPAFCVNWRRVGYFSRHVDKTNSVQMLLVSRNDQGDFDIVFNYGPIAWETGDASSGSNGLGGTPAGVGYSNGDGNAAHFRELDGSLEPGAFLDGGPKSLSAGSNVSPPVPGRYAFQISSGTTVDQASTCKPYYFVSARGSGEASRGVDDTDGSRIIKNAYTAMLDKYTAAGGARDNVTFYQLPYQAMSTDVLGKNLDTGTLAQREDQFFFTNLPTYMGSVEEGIDQLRAYVSSVERLCARQHQTPRFILFGYSQGSLVIHRYLRTLDASTGDSARNHIGYVGLVADPGRMAASSTRINWGTAPENSAGVCSESVRLLTADSCSNGANKIPAHFAASTEELCDSGDAVCATSQVLGKPIWQWKAAFGAGVTVHNSYGTKTAIMGKSAVNVARMR